MNKVRKDVTEAESEEIAEAEELAEKTGDMDGGMVTYMETEMEAE